MIGSGDFGDVIVAKLAAGAVHHMAQLARVDEQDFTAPVAQFLVPAHAVGFVLCQKPDAHRNLRGIK